MIVWFLCHIKYTRTSISVLLLLLFHSPPFCVKCLQELQIHFIVSTSKSTLQDYNLSGAGILLSYAAVAGYEDIWMDGKS